MPSAKILVVEDERIVARDIQQILQRAGYTVVGTAATGEIALEHAARFAPDLVLMDIVLAGDIDGIETARLLRQTREIPIVYLTANGDRAVLEQAKSTEPIAFILKPYEERELLTSIEVALHQWQTHQRRSKEALDRSEARFQELFDTARDGIAITDGTGSHLDCNRAYLDLLGFAAPEQLLGRALRDVTVPDYWDGDAVALNQALSRGYSDEYEKECLRKDGSRISISARWWTRRDHAGHFQGLWLLTRDITERKASERRALEYQEQLRSLMRQMATVEERERQRIANDIHDRISQTLAACQMRLEALGETSVFPEARHAVDEVCGLLERTIKDTSTLIFELSPPILHQLGLGPALEWFGEKLREQHGLKFQFCHEHSISRLPDDTRNAMFRSACELMTNVVKHARATSLSLELKQTPGWVEIIVTDDGVGFRDQASNVRRAIGGFGLFQIRERLWAWGGELRIGNRPQGGTCAIIRMPEPQPFPTNA